MRLAERREVVERSGLCTYCLRHAAELECYAKGGLSKPRCTRPGCDGEHASGLHALMGEADAEVNLVAGDEGEAVGEHEHEHEHEHEPEYGHQYECEYEGLWVGTLGATEVPKEANRSLGTSADQELAQCDDQTEAGGEVDQYEWEYEGLWVGTIGATKVPEEADRSAGVTAGREPAQDDDPVEVEEEAAEDEQWGLEAGRYDGRADGAKGPQYGLPPHPPGNLARPPSPTETSRPNPKVKLRAASDRQWEEAKHNAWLRQLWSDDSGDEDEGEEWRRDFAESGRWATELHGVPQHPTATSGRECSA
jgi:hypothetical protein